MKICILCGRKISNNQYNFGLSCLKKMCHTVGIDEVKNLNAEIALDKKILELANKRSLLKTRKAIING